VVLSHINAGVVVLIVVSCVALVLIVNDRSRTVSIDIPITKALPAPTERHSIEIPISKALPPSSERPSTDDILGQASVIDGDTIDIHHTRIRLSGIDAPESAQTCEVNGTVYRCGQRAAFALSDFIGSQTVQCRQTGTDQYHRVIAICRVAGVDLGAWMVAHGWAIAYRKYSRAYISDEEEAHHAQRGIWAGSFMPPEDWRRSKRKGNLYVEH
jgi:endonuclease YncB( thermonuclease family)